MLIARVCCLLLGLWLPKINQALPQNSFARCLDQKELGESCQSHFECKELAICRFGTCACPGGFVRSFLPLDSPGPRNSICVLGPLRGDSCYQNQCGPGLTCNEQQICECLPDRIAFDKFCFPGCPNGQQLIDGICLPMAGLGQPCVTRSQCVAAMSTCVQGICSCEPGTQQTNGRCTSVPICIVGNALTVNNAVVRCSVRPLSTLLADAANVGLPSIPTDFINKTREIVNSDADPMSKAFDIFSLFANADWLTDLPNPLQTPSEVPKEITYFNPFHLFNLQLPFENLRNFSSDLLEKLNETTLSDALNNFGLFDLFKGDLIRKKRDTQTAPQSSTLFSLKSLADIAQQLKARISDANLFADNKPFLDRLKGLADVVKSTLQDKNILNGTAPLPVDILQLLQTLPPPCSNKGSAFGQIALGIGLPTIGQPQSVGLPPLLPVQQQLPSPTNIKDALNFFLKQNFTVVTPPPLPQPEVLTVGAFQNAWTVLTNGLRLSEDEAIAVGSVLYELLYNVQDLGAFLELHFPGRSLDIAHILSDVYEKYPQLQPIVKALRSVSLDLLPPNFLQANPKIVNVAPQLDMAFDMAFDSSGVQATQSLQDMVGKVIDLLLSEKLDTCPSDHYCSIANDQDASGTCCPKIEPILKCPFGNALPKLACEVCPQLTHYCYNFSIAEYRSSICCPRACPQNRPVLVGGQCYPEAAYLGRCSVDDQCNPSKTGLQCRPYFNSDLHCSCAEGWHFILDSCYKGCTANEISFEKECLKKANLNEPCKLDLQCTSGSFCNNGYCTCKPGLISVVPGQCTTVPACPKSSQNISLSVLIREDNKPLLCGESEPCPSDGFCQYFSTAKGVCCSLPVPTCPENQRVMKDKQDLAVKCTTDHDCPAGTKTNATCHAYWYTVPEPRICCDQLE